jgi:hypothetical protein
MHSYIYIVAPHLGMLDAPREGRDVGAKPEDGVWRSIQKMGGLSKCQDVRYSPSKCHLTNNDPRSILSLLCFYKQQIELYMFDALGCRSWMETLDAYIFLVQIYIP